MASLLTRLTQAQAGIELIQQYLTEFDSKKAFCDAQPGTNEYKTRAAALLEFDSVAENLKFKGEDLEKITADSDPESVKKLLALYPVRNKISHKYGVSDVDFGNLWDRLAIDLPTILTIVQTLIEKEQSD